MVTGLLGHGANQSNILEALRNSRHELGNLYTGNTSVDSFGGPAGFSARFGVEGIDVGHSAGHVKEDTVFGFSSASRLHGLHAIGERNHADAKGSLGSTSHELSAAQLIQVFQLVFHVD